MGYNVNIAFSGGLGEIFTINSAVSISNYEMFKVFYPKSRVFCNGQLAYPTIHRLYMDSPLHENYI